MALLGAGEAGRRAVRAPQVSRIRRLCSLAGCRGPTRCLVTAHTPPIAGPVDSAPSSRARVLARRPPGPLRASNSPLRGQIPCLTPRFPLAGHAVLAHRWHRLSNWIPGGGGPPAPRAPLRICTRVWGPAPITTQASTLGPAGAGKRRAGCKQAPQFKSATRAIRAAACGSSQPRACRQCPQRHNDTARRVPGTLHAGKVHDGPSVEGHHWPIFNRGAKPGSSPHLQHVLTGRHCVASPAPGRCAGRTGSSKGFGVGRRAAPARLMGPGARGACW